MKVLDTNGLRTLWGKIETLVQSAVATLAEAINAKADAAHTHEELGRTQTEGYHRSLHIYNSGNDTANRDGGELNNVVISSWNGVSFTTDCTDGGSICRQQPITTVGIDCRKGKLYARELYDNGTRVSKEGHTHTMANITNLTAAMPTGLSVSVSGNTLTVQLHNAAGEAVGEAASVELPAGSGGGTQVTAPISAILSEAIHVTSGGMICALFSVTNNTASALTSAQAHSVTVLIRPDGSDTWQQATADLSEALTELAAGVQRTVQYNLTVAGATNDTGFDYRMLYTADDGGTATVCQGVWPPVVEV